jgi:hypothetical protein
MTHMTFGIKPVDIIILDEKEIFSSKTIARITFNSMTFDAMTIQRMTVENMVII